MRIIIYKQLKFKIDDNPVVNSIMSIRGTLFVSVDLEKFISIQDENIDKIMSYFDPEEFKKVSDVVI